MGPFQDLSPRGKDESVEPGFSLLRVLHCRMLQSRLAPPPLCGEEIRDSPHTNRGSRFSAYLWASRFRAKALGGQDCRAPSLVESLKFQTRSRRGYCCPSAQPLGQTSP